MKASTGRGAAPKHTGCKQSPSIHRLLCKAAVPPSGLTAPPVLPASTHSTVLHSDHTMQLSAALGRRAVPSSWGQPVSAPAVASVRQPQRSSRVAVATDAGSLSTVSARDKVLALLDQGFDNYNPGPELGAAVERLASCISAETAPARATMTMSHGTWEVFYAPHIANMSSAMGTRFQPIRYTLTPTGELISNVRYSAPLLGSGWLSASGSLRDHDDATLELHFNRFWVDVGEDKLRPVLQPGDAGDGELQEALIDRIIGAVGRVAFIKQLALFPVLYLDSELAVFKFPPLNSNIAVRKLM